MKKLNRLLRTLTKSQPADPRRFRPVAETLEAREVPTTGVLSITLMKSVPDVCYAPGSTATYTYTVTNPAIATIDLKDVTLSDDNGPMVDFTLKPGVDVAVTDDPGTPGDKSDDVIIPAGTVNPILEVGHTWTFQYSVALPSVTVDTTITNIATVTATGTDAENSMITSAPASATLHICVPTTPPTPLDHGDTATIGFWNNKNGQALIKSLDTGSTSTKLATWLATNFSHLYGVDAGANNLTGKTNADVAALFQKFFNVKGAKTDAQVLGAALAVYVTDSDLAGTTATKYGFDVSSSGTGAKTYNVGSLGTSIGLTNNTSYTILDLLHQADIQKAANTYNAGAFNSIFDGINQKGDII